MQPAIRKAPTPPLTLVGAAGRYDVILGKLDLGRVTKVRRDVWETSSGRYSRTLRRAAQALLADRIR